MAGSDAYSGTFVFGNPQASVWHDTSGYRELLALARTPINAVSQLTVKFSDAANGSSPKNATANDLIGIGSLAVSAGAVPFAASSSSRDIRIGIIPRKRYVEVASSSGSFALIGAKAVNQPTSDQF